MDGGRDETEQGKSKEKYGGRMKEKCCLETKCERRGEEEREGQRVGEEQGGG